MVVADAAISVCVRSPDVDGQRGAGLAIRPEESLPINAGMSCSSPSTSNPLRSTARPGSRPCADCSPNNKIDGLLVPRSDNEYLGEYVPPSAERLAWATGFTGSAGQLLVTVSKAVFSLTAAM